MCECVRAHVYIRYVNTLIYIYTHTCRIHRTLHTYTCLKACTIPSLVLLACSTVLITSNGCSNVCKRARTYTHTCACTCTFTYTPAHKQTNTNMRELQDTLAYERAAHATSKQVRVCAYTVPLSCTLAHVQTHPPTHSLCLTCKLSHVHSLSHMHTHRCTHLAGCRCEA